MNKQMRKLSQKEGERLQKLSWNDFKDVTEEAISRHFLLTGKLYNVGKVYQNNKYIVQVFYNDTTKNKSMTKILTRRSDGKPILSWSDLFRIKNEIFGEEIEAVQYLPKKSELIDEANLYWFFIDEGKK